METGIGARIETVEEQDRSEVRLSNLDRVYWKIPFGFLSLQNYLLLLCFTIMKELGI